LAYGVLNINLKQEKREMTQLVPFDSAKLPARLQKRSGGALNADLIAHASAGFPVLSIKGKIFTLVKGDERRIVTRPDDPDEAATALEVVILRVNPKKSKVYYVAGYEDGVAAKPDCYSNDGIKPAADSANPQCKTCAACPHNVWGSGKEGRGRACSDSVRIAIASPSQLNEPMLLRIPPATIKALGEYGKLLDNRNASALDVITKLRFEKEEATPRLTFTPVAFLDDASAEEAEKMSHSDLVETIVGISHVAEHATLPETVEEAVKEPVKVAKPAVKAAATVVAKEPEVEAVKEPAKPAKKANIAENLDDLLNGLSD
jgi:hypothetical protein